MDIFAIVLITITILTICGICFFMCLCTLQPKVARYVHRRKSRTYHIMASTQLKNSDGELDFPTKLSLPNQDKRAYLKILERSVRTGRKIQDEKDNKIKDTSRLKSFYSLHRYIAKRISSTAIDSQQTTSI